MTIEFDGLNYETGWRNDPAAVAATIAQDRIVSMSQAAPLKQWDGKTTINLGRYMDKVHGRGTWTLNQGSCGSCVAFGAAISIDTLLAIDHVENGATYPGRTDPMTIYGGSRVQIGGGKVWGQGSVGAWAAKWLKDYGVLLQKKYPGTDLTTYNASVCCSKFGRGGCPPALFPEARLHPIKAYAQAKTVLPMDIPSQSRASRGLHRLVIVADVPNLQDRGHTRWQSLAFERQMLW